ncbi:MAG: F0F1 ATP synthase subunit B [Dehalococcoidia bacterium]
MDKAFTALGINLPTLFAFIVNFVVLYLLLRKFLFGPVLKNLDERKRRIAESLQAAEEVRRQSVESQRVVQDQLDQARREGQQLLAQAQQTGARIQEESRAVAHRDQETMIARARGEIQLERDAAIGELRREFADLTIAAAEKVIGQSLDRPSHERLINQVLAESSFGGRGG